MFLISNVSLYSVLFLASVLLVGYLSLVTALLLLTSPSLLMSLLLRPVPTAAGSLSLMVSLLLAPLLLVSFLLQAVLWIRISFNADPDPACKINRIRILVRIQGFDVQKFKNFNRWQKILFFKIKTCNIFIPRPSWVFNSQKRTSSTSKYGIS